MNNAMVYWYVIVYGSNFYLCFSSEMHEHLRELVVKKTRITDKPRARGKPIIKTWADFLFYRLKY